jgi:hypothetical protein
MKDVQNNYRNLKGKKYLPGKESLTINIHINCQTFTADLEVSFAFSWVMI